MALCRIPYFPTPCSFFTFSSSSKPRKSHLRWNSNQNLVHTGLICAFSAEKPRKKKGRRPSRAATSDEDLCRELREVMAVAGLTDDRVPLMRELSEHGRKDLANIVRRRGYKAVWELLRTCNISDNLRETTSIEDRELSIHQGDETSEIEERHFTGSAESISSLRSSVVEDHFTETKGTMKNDLSVQICETSRFSIGPTHLVPADSYQEREFVKNVSGVCREAPPVKEEHQIDRDQVVNPPASTETLVGLAFDIAVDESSSQTEIDHLKALLHQKELELAELKQHIEKEKEALNMLQARAQNEIGNVHRIIWTKDAELRTAEDNLSGLKEVEIQYWAGGETVKVAGSFNGWHKSITMDPDRLSETFDLQGSRQFKLWSTILWLYPGAYEIKFIVDDQWRIDSGREVITYGNITNNVLRVDR